MGSGHDWCDDCEYDHKGDCPPQRLKEAKARRAKMKEWHDDRMMKLRAIFEQVKHLGFKLEVEDFVQSEMRTQTGKIILRSIDI